VGLANENEIYLDLEYSAEECLTVIVFNRNA